MRTNTTKQFLSSSANLPSSDLVKQMEDKSLKKKIITTTETSYDTKNLYTERIHIVPFCADYHMILVSKMKIEDAEISTPMPIDKGIVNQDDFVEARKFEVFAYNDPIKKLTKVELKSVSGSLLIQISPENRVLFGNLYFQYTRVYSIIISLIIHLFSTQPSIKNFVENIKEMYNCLDYTAIAFFVCHPKTGKYDEIAFFARNEEIRLTLLKYIDSYIQSPDKQITKITNYEGHRIFGEKYELGGIAYIFQCAINHSYFIVRSPEKMITSWIVFIISYYHANFSTKDDSHAYERLMKIIYENPLFSVIENKNDKVYQNGQIFGNNQLLTNSRQFNDLFNQCNYNERSVIRHNHKLISMIPQTFRDTNELTAESLLLKDNESKNNILHTYHHIYSINDANLNQEETNPSAENQTEKQSDIKPDTKPESKSDVNINTENNYIQSNHENVKETRMLFVEDLSYFSDLESKIHMDNEDIEMASSMLKLHKLLNESTLASDSLSKELGYFLPLTSLMELVYPDDVHLLREIKPDRIAIFRLKELSGNPAWYCAICAESPKKSFIGYIFGINEFSSDKNFSDDNFDDSILSAVNDLFALWSLDLDTGEVVSSIIHTPFVSAHIEDIYRLVHPNDVANFKECITKPGNGLSRCQLRMSLNNTNEYVWHEVLVSQIPKNKAIVLVFNISEQKATLDALVEARQLVDLALYHSSVVQWIFEDAETPERIFTSGPITYEPLLINWTSIYHNILPEFQEVTRNTFLKALNSDEPFEVKAPIFFDSIRWILLRGRRGMKKGQLIGVYFDLTELKEASNALEKQRMAAEEAASAKSMFLANMSHEIRTPLNGMCGLLEFLQASEVTEEEQVMLNYIQSSFTRLLELLNDTLDLAKIDQNKMQVSYANFAPADIFEPLYTQTYNTLKNNQLVNVEMDIDPNFPLLFYGDPHFTFRVITNLVSNAMKFTEKGTISLIVKQTQENTMTVLVKDTGIGISEEKQQMIFESFTQLDSSITRPYGGSGIGLSLFSKMVKLLNGNIKLESSPGEGSTFTVEFPFEPIYVPFLTKTLKSTKLFIFIPFNLECIELIRKFADFYGFSILKKPSEVNNENISQIKMIIIQNEKDQVDESLKILTKNSLLNKSSTIANEIRKFMILSSEKEKHDSQFEGVLLPLTASWLRKHFVGLKLHRKKVVERDLNNLMFDVLVAEDNQTNKIVVKKILQKLHCKFTIVDNGKEAIDELEQNKYDLILMDHHMPELDGPEATKLIRACEKEYSSIPIIAMTASTAKEDKDECLNAGMNSFVSKPVKVAELALIMIRVTNQTPEQY